MSCTEPPSCLAGRGWASSVLRTRRYWLLVLAMAFPQIMWGQDARPSSKKKPSSENVTQPPALTRASTVTRKQPVEAAKLFLEGLELDESLSTATLTVVRQHPDDRRWSGRSDSTLFAVATVSLPRRSRAVMLPKMLKLASVVALNELLQTDALLARYEKEGLDDATTLRQAVLQSAGRLDVPGSVKRLTSRARRQDSYAVALVFASEEDIVTTLLKPERLLVVKNGYRDVMHAQARQLMKRENWQDAVGLWCHLHQRKLVSPRLYLDAARCFQALDKNSDVVQVVDEALTAFAREDDWTFFEQAGELVLKIDNPKAQDLAERAFTVALQKYKSRRTGSP